MTEEQALLAAIHAHPREDTPRLIYSDYLEETGRPAQAEFVRKYRVGEPVGGMRELAQTFSKIAMAATRRNYRESFTSALNSSRRADYAAATDNHAKATTEHDKSVDKHTNDARRILASAPSTFEARIAASHLEAARHHAYSAHLHEKTSRDLGSPADQASEVAFEKTRQSGIFFYPQELDTAITAHETAAKMHEDEGNNPEAVARHRKMVENYSTVRNRMVNFGHVLQPGRL